MTSSSNASDLVEAALGGDRRALARLLTVVSEDPGAEVMDQVSARARGAMVVGITGPPGTGKSTLVDQLLSHLRSQGRQPGVVAVDPSSPFTGGAILGDRIRMQQHSGDDRVFIRSMGSRGVLGGIAAGTRSVVAVLDAAGFDPILVETVGVGQSELEVVKLAETVAVVLHPGWGDDVQIAKAGLLEIGHVFCVNKADTADSAATVSRLSQMVAMSPSPLSPGWRASVITTNALSGEGISELWEAIAAHRRHGAGEEAG
ncbi:MAG TPA: methylmalonyl Co-A mutase-associated GTPase MeaB [Acidimicrobiia bacterium]|nr:methylmalonyl Co-A mutase-associated GTPase MeaB [Acidimicrobiia bacterium]